MSAVADRILSAFERNVVLMARRYRCDWAEIATHLRADPDVCQAAFEEARAKLERNRQPGASLRTPPTPAAPAPTPQEAPMPADDGPVRSTGDVIAGAIAELEQRREVLIQARDRIAKRDKEVRDELRDLERSLGHLRRAAGQRALPAGEKSPRWPVPDNTRAAILARLAQGPAKAEAIAEAVGDLVGPRLYSWLKQMVEQGEVVRLENAAYTLPEPTAAAA